MQIEIQFTNFGDCGISQWFPNFFRFATLSKEIKKNTRNIQTNWEQHNTIRLSTEVNLEEAHDG